MSYHLTEAETLQNTAAIYYNKGLKLAEQNYISSAVKELKRAVCINQEDITVWNLLGLCYYRLGEYESSAYCWSESIKHRTEGNKAHEYLEAVSNIIKTFTPAITAVQGYAENKEYKKAIFYFENEVIGYFNPAAALFNYGGTLRYIIGDRSSAFSYFRKTLEIDRSNIYAARVILENARPAGIIKSYLHSWLAKLPRIKT